MPKRLKKVAKAAGRVKDIVADAIEDAGGTGYRAYLNSYSKGAQKISQTELGAQALRLYESAPRTFIKVIEGNDPKLIERIFWPRQLRRGKRNERRGDGPGLKGHCRRSQA